MPQRHGRKLARSKKYAFSHYIIIIFVRLNKNTVAFSERMFTSVYLPIL